MEILLVVPCNTIRTFLYNARHFYVDAFLFPKLIAEDVILKTVAVGLGDSDAVAGGAVHESQFGQFSHAFAAETAGGDVNPA